MSSWASDARRILTSRESDLAGVDSVHLFGSALSSSDPQDVDLLVVYDRHTVRPTDAGRLRDTIVSLLGPTTAPPIHIVLLTREEETSTHFAASENAEILFTRSVA
jgi:predicted nucleotidyltransferase